ncbi:MAG: hypothetical protein ACK5MT_00750 [Actinomycetales bacterium]
MARVFLDGMGGQAREGTVMLVRWRRMHARQRRDAWALARAVTPAASQAARDEQNTGLSIA